VGHILHEGFGERMTPPNTFEKLLKEKRLGKKSGAGFYRYNGTDKKEKVFEVEIYSLLGITPVPGKIDTQEMINRCVYSMVNEAARCLKEKVVAAPEDVDLGMIMGTGFPPFRGGLLRYADSIGLETIVSGLKELSAKYGNRFTPSDALLDFAKKGSFY
jgi:3-hydroxyacyl-CoA dehydrogenase/enoyl-CoA hydratase/3-hydroxybutyryl-CoA epimerase